MGLFGKIKNILFEEEEIEETPKRKEIVSEKQVVREQPERVEEKKSSLFDLLDDDEIFNEESKKQSIKQDDYNDNNSFAKAERTFDFPSFDEEEFESSVPKPTIPKEVASKPIVVEEPPKKVVAPVQREVRRPISKPDYHYDKVEEKKKFKPSPIISPVYGILDKDYVKEDIVPKKKETDIPRKKDLTIEMVRKKAFGSLEDEIEKTITTPKEDFYREIETELETEIPDELPAVEVSENEVSKLLEKSAHEEIEVTSEFDDDDVIINNEDIEIPEDSVEEDVEVDTSIDDIESELDKFDASDEDFEEDMAIPEKELEQLDKKMKEPDEDDTLEQDLFELIDSMYDDRKGD